jgi:7-cyano-7-deazaguanine synthase
MTDLAIVLLSGGMDSAAALYQAKADGFRPLPLVIDYGQKARRELAAARAIALGLGVEPLELALPALGLLAPSALTSEERPVPRARAMERQRTIVPFRNLHLLAWGATVAAYHDAWYVYFGATLEDAEVYPDCRDVFLEQMARVLDRANPPQPLRLKTPFLGILKAGVLRRGLVLGVPYALTWSCYQGGERPCTLCDACVSRAAAFAEVGVADPGLAGVLT